MAPLLQPSRFASFALLALSVALRPAAPGDTGGIERSPLGGCVIADSTAARRLLDTLKTVAPRGDDGERFHAADAPALSIPTLMALVSDSGLVIQDANARDSTFSFTRASVEASLSHRSGRAFTTLVHLAYVYSIPYPRYSTLAFSGSAGALIVRVGDWYTIALECRTGSARLRRIHHLESEDEW